MSGVFLDTSGLFASADVSEEHHVTCRDAYAALLRGGGRLVTTDVVLAELHALALVRIGPHGALVLARRVGSSPRVDVLPVTRVLREQALGLLDERPGRAYSLADAISFSTMRNARIETAFTLDADFAAEGFSVVPV